MGKIRVKTLGEESTEQEQKKRDEQRRAIKRAKKEGIAPEEVLEEKETVKKDAVKKAKSAESSPKSTEGTKVPPNRRPHVRSKRYNGLISQIDRNRSYTLSEAIDLVKKTANTKFNGTVEAHFNLTRNPKDLGLKKDKNLPVSYEKKSPLAHAKVGSVSDTEKLLKDQIEAIVKKIRTPNIKKLTLSSSMSPGIKVNLN